MYGSDIYDQRFRMLKSRLRHKLYDLLLHVEFSDSRFKISTQQYLKCREYIYKAHVLFFSQEDDMAEKQINKAFAIAEVAEFTDVLIDGLEILRSIYSSACKPTDFELTINRLHDLRKLYNTEEYANDIYFKNNMLLTKSIHSRKSNVQTTQDNISVLQKLWKETKSFNIYNRYYSLKLWNLELQGDYEGLIKFTYDAEKDVDKMKVNPMRFDIRQNVYIRTFAYLCIKDFKKGFESAEEGMNIIESTTANWFAHMENYFLLAMHSRNYDKAVSIYSQVDHNTNLKKASQKASERWELMKAYLNFAVPEKRLIKRLTFSDFYNSVEHYNKDKKGYNISLIILEFMHMLNKGDFDLAISKIDAVERYYYRHLNDPGKNPREKQFFKLIKVLMSSGYNSIVARENGQKYVDKPMEKNQYEPFTDLEIIPYEHLWDIMLQNVEKNKEVIALA
ncbi:MAG: hypothetical protein NWS46_09830 [Cyclobacteriaceae bacterium]|jgi:hypothetical protein|nr:hypothetical protein [Cyclobacteriaceae bacterium]